MTDGSFRKRDYHHHKKEHFLMQAGFIMLVHSQSRISKSTFLQQTTLMT